MFHIFFYLAAVFSGIVALPGEIIRQEASPETDIAFDLDWNPTDEILAVVSQERLWLLDNQLQAIDAYEYPPTATTDRIPVSVEWSPNGMWVAVNYSDGSVRVWSYPDGNLIFDRDIDDNTYPDTIRWHPTEPLLSTHDQIVNVQTGITEQPFIIDVYWGRTNDDPPLEQRTSGTAFWSPDGDIFIRLISVAGCDCSEYGIFDAHTGELIQSLGKSSSANDIFIWGNDGRYRVLDRWTYQDLLFASQIERVVYIEDFAYQHIRMPAIFVANTFEDHDQDIINHQVVYPTSLIAIDWTPNMPYGVTALNCAGEIISIDIRDMTISEASHVFAPESDDTSHCRGIVFPGYSNP